LFCIEVSYQPFPCRHVYLSDEAVAFTGCVMPRSVDETGFELITEEGGMPLYIDIRKHRNIQGYFILKRDLSRFKPCPALR